MEIKRTATFKRNYKAMKKKHYDMDKMDKVIKILCSQEKEILVHEYKDHALSGNLQGLENCI